MISEKQLKECIEAAEIAKQKDPVLGINYLLEIVKNLFKANHELKEYVKVLEGIISAKNPKY